jgi:hypothetical protein
MTIDELLALLSMDSYNRVYNTGLQNVSKTLPGASYIELEDLGISRVKLDAWKAAGFFAAAYRIAGTGTDLDGKTVIAYRGTDDPSIFSSISDIWNGWGIGAGSSIGPQARFAIEFYQAVAKADPNFMVDWRSANIALTGHSLGGGFAWLAA